MKRRHSWKWRLRPSLLTNCLFNVLTGFPAFILQTERVTAKGGGGRRRWWRKKERIYGGGGGGPVDEFTVEIRHPFTRQKSKKWGQLTKKGWRWINSN